jgi:D-alanine--poly(phosphoribitol) ligase subunit 1
VAVTDVLITPELAASDTPLPVGKAKPGTRIVICDAQGNCVPDGEKGEIVIIGDTVSPGYYHQEALTEKAFFMVAPGTYSDESVNEDAQKCQRAYKTGDEGYLEDGMLYYSGRIDLQIKLHGYRIELEDIENNIRRLQEIEHVVVVPNQRGGKVSSLTAYVVMSVRIPADEKAMSAHLRERLAAFLPSYMIPKKFVFLEQMPMTNNGKADRKLLGGRNA